MQVLGLSPSIRRGAPWLYDLRATPRHCTGDNRRIGRAESIDASDEQIKIRYDDGRGAAVLLAGRRLINGGTGDIVIIGHDDRGAFVAGYMRQDGLPSNCFVDNAPGVDRGDYIELRDILWSKASYFSSAVAVQADHAYPGGTRFCFNEMGLIWATVAA